MTSLHKQLNPIAIAILVTAAISIMACTEKAADNSSQVETMVSPVVSPIPQDKVARLQKEAQEGDPDAQYELAYLYENGLGVPKNETKALELYQQAADQGHPAAQDNIDAMNKSK